MSASAPETPTSPASNAAPAATTQSTPAAPVTETAKAAPAAEAKQAEPAKAEPKAEKFADKLAAAMKAPEKSEEPKAETVDLDLKVPEGADEHVVGFVKDAARIAGITGEKAQAVLDHVHKSLAEQRAAATEKVREDFARQLYEDKDYGGPKFEQTARDSAAFVRRFVPESAQKELEGKAIPPFLHIAFARAQQAISPDRFFQGKPASTASVDSDVERRNQRFPKSAPKG